MGIKIKEIADLAKVSMATVSLALNNKPGVSKATRQKILKIAQTIDEERGKQTGLNPMSKGSIRFLKIIKHGHVLSRNHEVFISRYIDGSEQEARAHGYNLEINTFRLSEIRDILARIKESSINGLVILATELTDKDLEFFEGLNVPMVFIDAIFDFTRFDFVDMNNTDAVFQIVNHFKKHNHREIGMIKSPVEARNLELRSLEFPNALKYFELPYNSKYVFSVDSTFNAAYHDMLKILKKGGPFPTAIFSSNDLMAYACIKALKEVGLHVPEDLSIIGFDDLPMSVLMEPHLSTIKVPQKQIGQMAINIILDRINGTLSLPSVKFSVGGELILRDSVKTL